LFFSASETQFVTTRAKNPTALLFLPQFHTMGLMWSLICLCRGDTIVVMATYSLGDMLQTIEKYKVRYHRADIFLSAFLKELMNK
jgi:acyl-CoA synthetase (AMP-forming)/AMP-acid ligase II